VVEGARGGQLEELSTASAPVRGTRIVHKSTGLPRGLGAFVQRAFACIGFMNQWALVLQFELPLP